VKARRLKALPKLAKFKAETVDPHRPYDLSEKLEPKWAKESTETLQLSLAASWMDMFDPIRHEERRESVVPTWEKSRTEIADPNRENCRILKLLPMCSHSATDMFITRSMYFIDPNNERPEPTFV
jgi:hypothetical protein